MNKVKFLTGLVIILLVINICLCTMMFRNKEQRPHPEGPKNEIIQKLHFDEAQVKQYDVLISKHRSDINKSQDEIKNLKNKLYAGLKNNTANTSSDSIIKEINKVQNNIEYIHLHHFQDIQKLCRPEQQPYFDELTAEIARLFSPHPPHHKK